MSDRLEVLDEETQQLGDKTAQLSEKLLDETDQRRDSLIRSLVLER